jgi:capsular exopolysaccharide synthesis family protein
MDPQLDEPDLRSYLGVIARRKWWVIGVAALFIGVSIAMSVLPEPQYRVKAQVLTMGASDPVSAVLDSARSGLDGNRIAESQVAILNGAQLRYEAVNAYNGDLPSGEIWKIRASAISRGDNANSISSVVEITLVSSDPDEAARMVNIYAQTYVETLKSKQEQQILELSAVLAGQLNVVQTNIATTSKPVNDLTTEINNAAAEGDTATVQAKNGERAQLQTELEPKLTALHNVESQLQEQQYQMQFSAQLANGGGAEVISPAFAPSTPVSPNLPRNLAIGTIFGLFLGIAAAFLRDYFDDSVKSKEMVEKVTGVPALGLIPKFDTGDSELVAAAYPTSPAAEAFRSLRTSVKFLGVDREVRVVQITSPSPGEGKTVIAANLATVFAQAGDRVVLVGGDLRRPRAEELLGVPLTPGLTGVLIGEVALPQAIRVVDGLPNLSVLPAGQPPPNPSELLSGERARRLIDVLAQTYDLVIIDCPPVLPVTDALVLARMADTTLLATSANRTSRRSLDRTVEMLDQVGAPLVGTVLTSMSRDHAYHHEPYRYETTTRYASHGSNGASEQHDGIVALPPGGDGGDGGDTWQPEIPTRN